MGEDLEEITPQKLATPADWHRRFSSQARWTQELRKYLFSLIGYTKSGRVLEVGCGTGAVLQNFDAPFGLDLNSSYLRLARQQVSDARLVLGDAFHIPLASRSFDLVFCHFLLLWIKNPAAVLAEMRRVTRPGGTVAALAEPDYGGRIDYPLELVELGQLQAQALEHQGANTTIGRQLRALFSREGFREIETGILGGQWKSPPAQEDWQSEWAVLENDLAEQLPADQLTRFHQLDQQAWLSGERLLFVPTFYAFGRV